MNIADSEITAKTKHFSSSNLPIFLPLSKIVKNMYRTHTCGELRTEHIGQTVTLSGWVQTIRKVSANLIFIDVRDRYGITQLSFNSDNSEDVILQAASKLGREFVIQATGEVIERASKNNNIPTGHIEIKVTELNLLNASKTPPFTIDE